MKDGGALANPLDRGDVIFAYYKSDPYKVRRVYIVVGFTSRWKAKLLDPRSGRITTAWWKHDLPQRHYREDRLRNELLTAIEELAAVRRL